MPGPADAAGGQPAASEILWGSRASDLLTARALGAVRRSPQGLLDVAALAGAALLGHHPNAAMRQWQHNVHRATGRRPDAALTRDAARSWARMVADGARLGDRSAREVIAAVEIADADLARLRHAHRDGGAVLALPHLGSWDFAGAWVTRMGMPVSTVAEQLSPETHGFLVASRQRMGMRVHPHTAPDLGRLLADDLRGGRLVCLLSDRGDLTRWGTRVHWPTPTGALGVRMPNGAARLAVNSGAALFAVTTWYTPSGLHIDISEQLTAAPGPGQVRRLCQQLAEHFAAAVAAHPADWHMLVPFFEQDRGHDPAGPTATAAPEPVA